MCGNTVAGFSPDFVCSVGCSAIRHDVQSNCSPLLESCQWAGLLAKLLPRRTLLIDRLYMTHVQRNCSTTVAMRHNISILSSESSVPNLAPPGPSSFGVEKLSTCLQENPLLVH